MLNGVFTSRDADNKIGNIVVQSIAILVMHDFCPFKNAIKIFLHHLSMLKNISSLGGIGVSRIINIAIAFRNTLASSPFWISVADFCMAGTRAVAHWIPFQLGRLSQKVFSTGFTDARNHAQS